CDKALNHCVGRDDFFVTPHLRSHACDLPLFTAYAQQTPKIKPIRAPQPSWISSPQVPIAITCDPIQINTTLIAATPNSAAKVKMSAATTRSRTSRLGYGVSA